MPDEWMPRDQWDALVRGDGCPLCLEVASSEPANADGFFVADLAISRLQLQRNQFIAGYCVLICHEHAREPYELSREQYVAFFDDMMAVGAALDRVFEPLKMNFLVFGNAVPHVHAHLVPRYHGDPAPHRPIDPWAEDRTLTDADYERLIREIRAELVAVTPPKSRPPA